jgi:hypothetical protein
MTPASTLRREHTASGIRWTGTAQELMLAGVIAPADMRVIAVTQTSRFARYRCELPSGRQGRVRMRDRRRGLWVVLEEYSSTELLAKRAEERAPERDPGFQRLLQTLVQSART